MQQQQQSTASPSAFEARTQAVSSLAVLVAMMHAEPENMQHVADAHPLIVDIARLTPGGLAKLFETLPVSMV